MWQPSIFFINFIIIIVIVIVMVNVIIIIIIIIYVVIQRYLGHNQTQIQWYNVIPSLFSIDAYLSMV